mmetsp:Transcript_362/g.1172  ORF Transcript_362/g.1172 Transcript_362/m.1172 type:complete len:95 (+) Transcript_362:180-464(+)|eukprot:scaffold73929_cov39-Tisochrysis_lutea.AAC.2
MLVLARSRVNAFVDDALLRLPNIEDSNGPQGSSSEHWIPRVKGIAALLHGTQSDGDHLKKSVHRDRRAFRAPDQSKGRVAFATLRDSTSPSQVN